MLSRWLLTAFVFHSSALLVTLVASPVCFICYVDRVLFSLLLGGVICAGVRRGAFFVRHGFVLSIVQLLCQLVDLVADWVLLSFSECICKL